MRALLGRLGQPVIFGGEEQQDGAILYRGAGGTGAELGGQYARVAQVHDRKRCPASPSPERLAGALDQAVGATVISTLPA